MKSLINKYDKKAIGILSTVSLIWVWTVQSRVVLKDHSVSQVTIGTICGLGGGTGLHLLLKLMTDKNIIKITGEKSV